jgi:SAM-dependent methyltransferase
VRTLRSVARAVVRYALRAPPRASAPADPAGMRETFASIHRTNGWGGTESVSGPGSGIERTALLRQDLSRLVSELRIDTFLDAGCGDFFWMRETNLRVRWYSGLDVVPEIIDRNRRLHSSATRDFQVRDITTDPLPRADLIFCRDCLVHLPLRDVRRALDNFARSGATYLLTTTFVSRTANPEIPLGDWRPLNLQQAPFDWPPPLREIDERCPPDRGDYADKRLGLWRLAPAPGATALRIRPAGRR